jgi:hypothetical protein
MSATTSARTGQNRRSWDWPGQGRLCRKRGRPLPTGLICRRPYCNPLPEDPLRVLHPQGALSHTCRSPITDDEHLEIPFSRTTPSWGIKPGRRTLTFPCPLQRQAGLRNPGISDLYRPADRLSQDTIRLHPQRRSSEPYTPVTCPLQRQALPSGAYTRHTKVRNDSGDRQSWKLRYFACKQDSRIPNVRGNTVFGL